MYCSQRTRRFERIFISEHRDMVCPCLVLFSFCIIFHSFVLLRVFFNSALDFRRSLLPELTVVHIISVQQMGLRLVF